MLCRLSIEHAQKQILLNFSWPSKFWAHAQQQQQHCVVLLHYEWQTTITKSVSSYYYNNNNSVSIIAVNQILNNTFNVIENRVCVWRVTHPLNTVSNSNLVWRFLALLSSTPSLFPLSAVIMDIQHHHHHYISFRRSLKRSISFNAGMYVWLPPICHQSVIFMFPHNDLVRVTVIVHWSS